MSKTVNDSPQKEKLGSKQSKDESQDFGLSVAPPPFQMAATPTPPPSDQGGSGDLGDTTAVQRKINPDAPSDNPSENGGNNNPGTFQLKASAGPNGNNGSSNSSSGNPLPFQLKKASEAMGGEEKEGFTVQRKTGGGGDGGAAGGGGNVMGKMEGALGADFSNVNIHTNSSSATDVGALAYTQGNDIHFAPGQFNPHSQGGQELLGHELAHVVQQREGRVKPTTEVNGMAVNDNKGLEQEADDLGKKAAQFKSEGGGGSKKSGSADGSVSQNKLANEKSSPDEQSASKDLDQSNKEQKTAGKETAKKTGESLNQADTAEQKAKKQDAKNPVNGQKENTPEYTSGDPTSNNDQQKEKQQAQTPAKDGGDVQNQDQTGSEPVNSSISGPNTQNNTPQTDQNSTKEEPKPDQDKAAGNDQDKVTEPPQDKTSSQDSTGADAADKAADAITTDEPQKEGTDEPQKEGETPEGADKEEGKDGEDKEGKEEGKDGEGKDAPGKEGADAKGGAKGKGKGKGTPGAQGAKGGADAAAGGGGQGGAKGAAGGKGGPLAKGGSVGGSKPEGDFSRSKRRPMVVVPKERANEVPKEKIVTQMGDGSLIAQQINPSQEKNEKKMPPSMQQQGPVQMKPDGDQKPPIKPVPQGQQDKFYNDRDNKNNAELEKFKASTSQKLEGYRNMAGDIESRLGGVKTSAANQIQNNITANKAKVNRQYQHGLKRANSEAKKIQNFLKQRNTSLKTKIKAGTKSAKSQINSEFKTTMAFLAKLDKQMGTLVDQEIAKGAGEIRKVGTDKGAEAVRIASERAGQYAAESLPEMGRLEKLAKGGDYYAKKRQAKVDAANKVGAGYSEQFVAKANEAAGALEAKKAEILQGARDKMKEAYDKVKARKESAFKEVEASEKASITAADDAYKQNVKAVKAQLTSVKKQLQSTKTSSLNSVTQGGKAQLSMLDEIHKTAVSGMKKQHADGVASVEKSINAVIAKATSLEKPDPARVKAMLDQARGSVFKSVDDLQKALQKGISDSGKGYHKHKDKARKSLNDIYMGARKGFLEIVDGFRKGMGEIKKGAQKLEKDILKKHQDSGKEAAKNAVKDIKALKNDTDSGFGAVKKNIKAKVTESKGQLNTEFDGQLGGIHGEISKKAKEASDAVKPRWKAVLAIVIKVIIAIAVTVAIGLLAASGVGLLAGLGLAFLIGAAGAILETAALDLIIEGKFSGLGTYFKNAIMGGIGGMFTFVGARWGSGAGDWLAKKMGGWATSAGMSSFLSKAGSYIGEVGVGFAVDTFGTFAKNVTGQLYDNVQSVIQGNGWQGMDFGAAAKDAFSLENLTVNFLGNLGGKVVGDWLTTKGIGGKMGSAVEWINGKLPRWAMSAEHLAKIDVGGGSGIDVNTNNVDDALKTDVGGSGGPEVNGPKGDTGSGSGGPEVNGPKGDVEGPKGDVEGPKGDVEGPKGDVEGPKGDVEGPKGDVEGPKGDVEGPKGDVEGPKGDAEGPKTDTEGPKSGEGPKTDTEGPKTDVEGPKTGAEMAKDLGYPDAPNGYQWVRNGRGSGVYLRRVGQSGGSPLRQVRYTPDGKFVDVENGQIFNSVAEVNAANNFHLNNTAPSAPATGPEFDAFKGTADFKGDDLMATQAYELWRQGKWVELEAFMRSNGLNGNWPPNDGFISRSSTTLPAGTRIDRYGHPGGKFVAPEATPYTNRALPPGSDGKPYYVYEVVNPVQVESGGAIPWFGESGGGIQYLFDTKIEQLVKDGILRVIVSP